MPPDTPAMAEGNGEKGQDKDKEGHGHSHRHHRDRVGPFVVGAEIGRGSFATVYKGHRSKTHQLIAIKAVSRQKLTAKLLENLESEINILKAISHKNIVGMEDCFKSDSHIYLVMEYCSGSDLSIYIKNRGRLPTLDYYPRGVGPEGQKVFWPHPPSGGIDERVTRCFLGQLAQALQFLRSQDLIHRDIKPQNLLLQPASPTDLAEGHPLGIPLLKVADFGFARILPAAAMAETLCGSPLYMAPEILRYEKYDAKADLWSVGAVLFEMAVGKPPFRANNHVELLRKIEKGEDRIKFPDESSRIQPTTDSQTPLPLPVPADIKALIRGLLKRHPTSRMGFDDFFGCGVWEGHMMDSKSTEEGSLSFDASTDSSALIGDTQDRIQEMLRSSNHRGEAPSHRAPQPLATDPALNPQPAPNPNVMQVEESERLGQPSRPPPRRSEPKYYVSDDVPTSGLRSISPTPPPMIPPPVAPRPIQTPAQRRLSGRATQGDTGSIEDPPPTTPQATNTNIPPFARPRGISEGSPLASTPPITYVTGKEDSALEGDDSVVGREYVVVEKRTVEVNALADELDRALASKKPEAPVRRPSSRTSVVTRPVSSFKPSSEPAAPVVPISSSAQNAIVSQSYSPPFALPSTPPFAFTPSAGRTSATGSPTISRNSSIAQNLSQIPQTITVFPPAQLYDQPRYGTSPSSLQTGALARALTNTAIKLIGTGANAAGNVLARATSSSKRRPTIIRTGEIDPEEDDLLRAVEDYARKAFVLFELADQRLLAWQSLASLPAAGNTPSPRRKSSSSSMNSEVALLRQQEAAAGEAVVLFAKALSFIAHGVTRIQKYWERRNDDAGETSSQLNEMVQWLRARFNECLEKAEWAKSKCAEELPFVERLLHDKARDLSRHAAIAELQGDFTNAESGYESSLWLLQALMDGSMYDTAELRPEDKIGVEKLIVPIKVRLEALRKKMIEAGTRS